MQIKIALLMLMADLAISGPMPAADVLELADARIQKHRRGEAVLRLIGPMGEPLKAGSHVRIEQTRHKFLFGADIFMLGNCRTEADNLAYAQEFADLLNYATVPFYWWMYEPEEGQPRYAETKRLAQWCDAHHVTMKGHPLAWNEGQPSWLPPDPARAMHLQLIRVGQCVHEFAGEINIWDVVNEATHFDRSSTQAGGPTLTEAIRRMEMPAYIRAAFKEARRANPTATLVINDYETGPEYADKVISQLVDEGGYPLYDVIGIQCHQHTKGWSTQEIWDICERFAKFGKPLHFTEATILSGKPGWELKQKDPNFKWESTPEGEKLQAEEAAQFYTILFSHPAVEAITWWDFSDQGAWQGAPAGLVREDMTPKPVYTALKQLIKGKWWTRTEAEVSTQGEARFRGFFGQYKVTASQGGRELTGVFSLDKTTQGPIEVRLK
jgi:GH35 family endo-1,4-beta-xylanase